MLVIRSNHNKYQIPTLSHSVVYKQYFVRKDTSYFCRFVFGHTVILILDTNDFSKKKVVLYFPNLHQNTISEDVCTERRKFYYRGFESFAIRRYYQLAKSYQRFIGCYCLHIHSLSSPACNNILRNVGNILPIEMAQYLRTLQSSLTAF
jgi:hypothetical protein